jgi:hypothetical protein
MVWSLWRVSVIRLIRHQYHITHLEQRLLDVKRADALGAAVTHLLLLIRCPVWQRAMGRSGIGSSWNSRFR